MAKKLALDELPKQLLKEDKKVDDILMLYGFVGEGTQEDNITFYLDTTLKTSIIIRDEDIIHHVKVTKAQNPIGGTVIWIQNTANYMQHTTTQEKVQPQTQQNAAQFFQGDIYQQFANTVQGNTQPNPQAKHIPVCGCGKCGH